MRSACMTGSGKSLAGIEEVVSNLSRCSAAVVRRCNVENVHAMRVATRRARALLWSLKPWVGCDDYERCARRLKAITTEFAPLRDLDVLAVVLPGQVGMRTGLSGTQRHQLSASVESRRAQARQGLRALLDSEVLQGRVGKICKVLSRGALHVQSSAPVADAWERRILRSVEKVERRAHRAKGADLHGIRIRARRCRYTLEALGVLAPRQSLNRMKRIQASVGQFCDARLAAAWLQHNAVLTDADMRRRLVRVAQKVARRRKEAAIRMLRGGVGKPESRTRAAPATSGLQAQL
jgi:CHAD domain-containing protein